MKKPYDLKALTSLVWNFREARNWAQFHHPKELAAALSIEVSEVLELFRFRTTTEVTESLQDPSFQQDVGAECADILFLLLLLAHECHLDLEKSFQAKLQLLETRYPIDRASGKNLKWTAYQNDSNSSLGPHAAD